MTWQTGALLLRPGPLWADRSLAECHLCGTLMITLSDIFIALGLILRQVEVY
jgi:hypothetical protein